MHAAFLESNWRRTQVCILSPSQLPKGMDYNRKSGKEWKDRDGIVSLSADYSTENRLNRNSWSTVSLRRKCVRTKELAVWGRTTSKRTDSVGGEGASTLGHVEGLPAQWWWIRWGSRCAGCTPSGQTPDSSHQAENGTVAGEVPPPPPSLPHCQSHKLPPCLQLAPGRQWRRQQIYFNISIKVFFGDCM